MKDYLIDTHAHLDMLTDCDISGVRKVVVPSVEVSTMEKVVDLSNNDNIFSIGHTYVQNGDLMYDPMISFIVDYENEKVIQISYENSGMGIYESYDPNAEPTPQSVQNINGVLEFMDTWLDNIEQQGYEPVVPDEDRNRGNNDVSL